MTARSRKSAAAGRPASGNCWRFTESASARRSCTGKKYWRRWRRPARRRDSASRVDKGETRTGKNGDRQRRPFASGLDSWVRRSPRLGRRSQSPFLPAGLLAHSFHIHAALMDDQVSDFALVVLHEVYLCIDNLEEEAGLAFGEQGKLRLAGNLGHQRIALQGHSAIQIGIEAVGPGV